MSVFPNHVQSAEFRTGGLQKSLEDEQRNQDALELNSQLHGKGYEYLGTVDFFVICF